MKWAVFAMVVYTALLGTPQTLYAEVLRSPWDLNKVQITATPYDCPEPIHLSADLTTDGFYSDNKSSIIDPLKWKAYSESSGPYKKLGEEAVEAADSYRATGSRAAAQCVLNLLDSAAADGVFTGKMSSRQAYYVQGWVIGALAIAFLKVRDSGLVRADETPTLTKWMNSVARQTMDFYDATRSKPGGDGGNNHLYWQASKLLPLQLPRIINQCLIGP